MKSTTRREFLGFAGKYAVLGLGAAPVLSALVSGCVGTDEVGLPDLGSLVKVGQAVAKSFEDITPEQEYYIGRTVGAQILQRYQPYTNKKANDYINLLGQTLARVSDLPQTYGGYHFLIQDSDEINALAAPGGLIFITRGILKCCKNEDAVAAVLAHEIGHVESRHGLQAIKKSRVTSALTMIGLESAKTFGGEDLAKLTETFEDSISDITATLINSGYSRAFESQADRSAVKILRRIGYNPAGLLDMLKVMQKQLKPGRLDFAKTHPSPESRISDVSKVLGTYTEVKPVPARQKRFSKALRKI
jgi:predicted Zn-dependent protease